MIHFFSIQEQLYKNNEVDKKWENAETENLYLFFIVFNFNWSTR